MAKAMVEIVIDDKELKRLERKLAAFPKAMPRVMRNAINKTSTAARADSARRIKDKTGIKVTVVKKGLPLFKATLARWVSRIHFSGRRIPVIDLDARQTKKGVTFRSTKTKGRILIKSGFKATMPKASGFRKPGHLGVFVRKVRGGKFKEYDGRLPIGEQRGPSLKEIFVGAPVIVAAVTRKAFSTLGIEITRQAQRIFNK
jgi:hypothetical protein